MQTLIKTIQGKSGEIYGLTKGRRIPVAKCAFEIEVYKRETNTPILGVVGYEVKVRYDAEVNGDMTDGDPKLLTEIPFFEIKGDLQRSDGTYEVFYFEHIQNLEIDTLNDTWSFNISDKETIKKLIAL